MKIIFIGNVQIGLTVLSAVYRSGYAVDTVITSPADSVQISGFVDFAPLAKKNKSRIMRVTNLNKPECVSSIKEINPDLIIVCGWQRLVCPDILKIPRLGTIGFHSSLLPKYRGRAPVNWAIMLGEKETGVTMFYLEPEADTGDIIAQKSFPILFSDDCRTIYEKSAHAAAGLIEDILPKIEKNEVKTVRNESANYKAYPKRTPADGLINFNRSALEVYNFVRAITRPYPGAFYYDERGNKIMVWKIEIISDESGLKDTDVVMPTKDFKIRLVDYEKVSQ